MTARGEGNPMSGEQEGVASLGIEQYLFVLKRQWRVIVAATVLGALAAAGYLLLAPSTVTATTTINLNVITTEPFSAQRAASGLLDDATETAIARSHVVAIRAADIIGDGATAGEIRAASTVSTSSGAAVVTVDYEASTADEAIAGADAVASAYLAFRSEQAGERISVMVSNLTERIDALNTTLGAVNQTLAGADPGSVEYAQATTQRQQILTELDGLLSERNGLQSVDTTGGIVLSAAKDNTLDYAPARTVTLLTGITGGFVAGVIAAFVRNPFDRRLRNAKEMARVVGAPVFATVDSRAESIPAVGEAADALRVARERLLVDVRPGSVVLVVDATRATQISPTGVNLAVVTAQSGLAVQTIVPEMTSEFSGKLEEALGLRAAVEGVRVSARIPALRFFDASDENDESQGDLLMTQATIRAIETGDEAGLTFLVLSSSAHTASILAALRASDAVVIVCRERATITTEVRWLVEESAALDTPIRGVIAEKSVHSGTKPTVEPVAQATTEHASRRSAEKRARAAV